MLPLFLLGLSMTPTRTADAQAALDRGTTALRAKDTDGARIALRECLELEPEAIECRWQLGWAEWSANNWDAAVQAWERVATANPNYETIHAQLPAARAQRDLVRAAAAARLAAPPTVASHGGALRLRLVGDMMIGTAFPEGALPPDSGESAFASVTSLLQDADVTIGNLEGPLCDDLTPSSKCAPTAAPGSCYAFRTPTAYARHYKNAGFDVVSTANNHSGDFGDVCRAQTETALDAIGVRWSGRPGTVAEWVTNNTKVGFVAFHTNMACNYLNDVPAAAALVAQLAARNAVVVVMFHGGAEGSKAIHVPVGVETFYGEDRGDLRTFTHAMVDAGADLVVGAGPHVLRGLEFWNGKLIAYSLGNFATYGRFNLAGNQGVGAVLEVQLDERGAFTGGRLFGTRQTAPGYPKPDPDNAAADLIRSLTLSDFPGSGAVIGQDGTIGQPPA